MRTRIPCALFALIITVCLCDCAVPIAPGYRIINESRDIQFMASTPPALKIQSAYTLVNSGTAQLTFLDVTLPSISTFGLTDLHAELDGLHTECQDLPAELRFDSPNAMRIVFGSHWKQGAKHDLAIQYSFRSPSELGSQITLNATDFHIGSRGGFAQLQPPKHLLAPYPKRPNQMYYTVRVPADFRVLARGTPAGRKQEGAEIAYRYRLLSTDLAPFVVAGRYAQSAPLGDSGPVFWTLQPVSVPADVAKEIYDAWETLEKDYGPLDKNIRAPHIVETSHLPPDVAGEEGPAAAAFPGGALVDAGDVAQSGGSAAFVDAVSHALAHNWFGDEMYAVPNATLGIGEGLPEYATIVIDGARGGQSARSERIADYLEEFDVALKEGTEQTLAVSRLTDPQPERRIALAKAPLFFAALEDECGSTAMQAALEQVVTLMRGQEVGYAAIRAALEETSGKNLAPVFRLWLNEKGIPDDFRARYATKGAAPNHR